MVKVLFVLNSEINPLTGKTVASRNHIMIFPNSHYVTTSDKMEHAITTIEEEMKQQVEYFKSQGKLIEAQRIEERTNFDIEMMKETGFCLLMNLMLLFLK